MTWSEFKALLPVRRREKQAFDAWQTAVQAILAEEHGLDQGNDDGGAEGPTISSTVSPSESPGPDFSTLQP